MEIRNVGKDNGEWVNRDGLWCCNFHRFKLWNMAIWVHSQDVAIQQHGLAVDVPILGCQVVLLPCGFSCLGGDKHFSGGVATEIDQQQCDPLLPMLFEANASRPSFEEAMKQLWHGVVYSQILWHSVNKPLSFCFQWSLSAEHVSPSAGATKEHYINKPDQFLFQFRVQFKIVMFGKEVWHGSQLIHRTNDQLLLLSVVVHL